MKRVISVLSVIIIAFIFGSITKLAIYKFYYDIYYNNFSVFFGETIFPLLYDVFSIIIGIFAYKILKTPTKNLRIKFLQCLVIGWLIGSLITLVFASFAALGQPYDKTSPALIPYIFIFFFLGTSWILFLLKK